MTAAPPSLIGAFLNLPMADAAEVDARKKVLKQRKTAGGGDLDAVKSAHGEGVFHRYGEKAIMLATVDPKPDIFFASCWPTLKALKEQAVGATKGIVFGPIIHPDGAGYDYYYGQNATGIVAFEPPNLCPNWLTLLRQIAPNITTAAVIHDMNPEHNCGTSQFAEIEKMNNSLPAANRVALVKIDMRFGPQALAEEVAKVKDNADLAGATAGLIVTAGTLAAIHRDTLVGIAKDNLLPAIYPNGLFNAGLISFGPNLPDLYKKAGEYLKEILDRPIPANLIHATLQTIVNKDAFDLHVNMATVDVLRRGGVALNITDTMRVTVNGVAKDWPVQRA